MKGKHKLYILYEYQLNIYLTVDSVVKLSQKMNSFAHISVRDMCVIDPHKLVITQPFFNNFGGQFPKFAGANFGNWPPKCF